MSTTASTSQGWITHPDNDTPAKVAERFGRSIEWAHEHVGPHRCVDGHRYVASCLVSDPTCEAAASWYINKVR